ncbi:MULTISPECIES: LacI family DNA-binding transcriptional regulator [unclassified Vibrio]|uniref:LacI family DNA-binding transcriptional regulator n=1 Tax=Vibrio sp. HB236076 TaxID=3232307 RepID=A0AB39HIV5_9VIBR|nr:LacI family DNA-binding transcriptional regulator [Vibrio sp. HB161653]MDP5254992.1 LacI family DNA-binding transcriptional regulator [Vibrio sp. HB161653]
MNKINKKNITAADVANYVGVSRSAVSRALTPGASIDEKKRQAIIAAAHKLGYQPNLFARTLSTPLQYKRSNLVAILVSDFSNPYQSFLFETLSDTLQQQGKQPVLVNVRQHHDLASSILRLSGYQVDGVIAIVGSLPVESFEQCLQLSLPLVTLGRADESGRVPSVQTDNYQAGVIAANHLLSKGFTELGYIAGRVDGSASNERWQGFSDTVSAATGRSPDLLQAQRYSYHAGYDVGKLNAPRLSQWQGVFCASDALALGLMDACRQVHQIAIPQRLSIVGCDDIPQAKWSGYQLTTVAQPVQAISLQVMETLKQMWSSTSVEAINAQVRLAPELMIRQT